jgi:toxin HigB-1
MIKSFKHKGLKELFETGRSSKVQHDLRKRVKARLDVIDAAQALADLYLPGYHFHQLTPRSLRWSVKVSGPWRLTFFWQDGAVEIDLAQYH